MILAIWNPPPRPGRHRRPTLHVDESMIPDDYLADVARFRADGLGVDEAMRWAGMDADDRLAAWNWSA